MKRITIISVTTSIALVSYIFSVSFAQSNKENRNEKPKPQDSNSNLGPTGRYSLKIIERETKDFHGVVEKVTVLYRIDTVTGTVSAFDPTDIHQAKPKTVEEWWRPKGQPKSSEEIKMEIVRSAKEGIWFIENTYWRELPEGGCKRVSVNCLGLHFTSLPLGGGEAKASVASPA